jgi:hypothetical protein
MTSVLLSLLATLRGTVRSQYLLALTCRSRIPSLQAATGSWTRPRQWEIHRT